MGNEIEGSEIGKHVRQETDGGDAGNKIAGSKIAGGVDQRVKKLPGLNFGGASASGVVGIVALVIILAAYFVYRYFVRI